MPRPPALTMVAISVPRSGASWGAKATSVAVAVTVGRNGVNASTLVYGGMIVVAGCNSDHDECIRIIHRALDAGINLIDTADVYSRGESEEIVGKALEGGRRDHIVLATKVHGTM